MWEREPQREIIDSTEAIDTLVISMHRGLLTLPSPHPSIHLSALHPLNSPPAPLALQGRPCLPSVVCPSQEQPCFPSTRIYNSIKSNKPRLPPPSPLPPPPLHLFFFFFSRAWMSTAERPIPHVGMQSWHTLTRPSDDANTHWHINTQSVCKRAKERDTRSWTRSRTQGYFFFLSSFWRGEWKTGLVGLSPGTMQLKKVGQTLH